MQDAGLLDVTNGCDEQQLHDGQWVMVSGSRYLVRKVVGENGAVDTQLHGEHEVRVDATNPTQVCLLRVRACLSPCRNAHYEDNCLFAEERRDATDSDNTCTSTHTNGSTKDNESIESETSASNRDSPAAQIVRCVVSLCSI